MKTIDVKQLKDILLKINHATPLTIATFTDARCKKTNNPFCEIRKLSRVNGFTSFDYEKSVQRQEMREGHNPTFQAQERAWGKRISSALVSDDKGEKFYLVIQPKHCAKPIYIAKKTLGSVFKPVSKESIAAFLPVVKPSANQGTDKEVIYRNYSLDNIAALNIDGEQYRVRHSKI